jgi:hypothetical protein
MSLYQQAVKDGKASQHMVKAQTAKIEALESNLASQNIVKAQTAPNTAVNFSSKTTPMKEQDSPTSVMERQLRSDLHRRGPTPPPIGSEEKAILAGRKLIANRHPAPPISRPPSSVVITTPSPRSSYMLTASPRVSASPRPRSFAPPKQFGAKRMDPPASIVTGPPTPPLVQPSSEPTKVSPRGLALPRRGFGSIKAAPKPVVSAPNTGPTPRKQLRVETKEVSPPTPPPTATKRAYNRFHAVQAAGGSKAIREKFIQARRSPLGNATNRASSGAIF